MDTEKDQMHWLRLPEDPRTKGWLMVDDPTIPACLILVYLLSVKIIGPYIMKDRKPFDLRKSIIAYNVLNVALSALGLYHILRLTYIGGGYNMFCQSMNYSTDDNALEYLRVIWWIRWLRVADFLDTVFFVMRKKDNQISTLHVVHHALVVFDGWLYHRIGADGQAAFILALNTFVHIIMYTYYALSAMGPALQPYLWWKRYLTQLQIGQFVIAILHALIPLVKDCGYPKSHIYLGIPQGVLFLYLFVDFYLAAYRKKLKQLKKDE